MAKKGTSRAARWAEAEACSKADTAGADLSAALEELIEIQSEYEEWKDNLPENLQTAPVGEKLEAVCNLDLQGALDSLEEVTETITEANNADLPQGFGRD